MRFPPFPPSGPPPSFPRSSGYDSYRGTTIVLRDRGPLSPAIRQLRGRLSAHLRAIYRTLCYQGLPESVSRSQAYIITRQIQARAPIGNWYQERRKPTRIVLINDHLKAILGITGSKAVPPISAIEAWKRKVRPGEEITPQVLYRTQEFLRQRIRAGGWALSPRLDMPDILRHIESVIIPNVIHSQIRNTVDRSRP